MAKLIWVGTGLLIAIVLIAIVTRQKPNPSVESQTPTKKKETAATDKHFKFSSFTQEQNQKLPKFATRKPTDNNLDSRIIRYNDQSVDFVATVKKSRDLNTQKTTTADIQLISEILLGYQTIYQENPVGENHEITAHLLGLNPKKVVFIDPAKAPVSSNGELVDRWGTPYFFHSLSAKEMDIRSAGADGKLWTDDDVLLDK